MKKKFENIENSEVIDNSVNIEQKNKWGDNIIGNKYVIRITPWVLIAALIAIGIWQKDEIKVAMGWDKHFTENDQNFKIIILPFKQLCEGNGYDAGYAIKERLNGIIHKDSLKVKTFYWDNFDVQGFNDYKAEELRKYHHADMIIYGMYQGGGCSAEGNQICLNFLTDKKWNLGEAGIDIDKDTYQRGGLDELKKGKIQEKVENIAIFVSVLAQVKTIDHRQYLLKLQSLLQEKEVGVIKGYVYAELAAKFGEEGKSEEALLNFQKALDVYEKAKDEYRIAIIYRMIGNYYNSIGEVTKALNFHEKSYQIYKKLCETKPIDIDFKNSLASSCQSLGLVYSELYTLDKSLEFFKAAHKISYELYSTDSSNIKFSDNLATSCKYLGIIYDELKNSDKSFQFDQESHRLRQKLYQSNPNHLDLKDRLAKSYISMGDVYKLNNSNLALELYEKSLKLSRELFIAYPENMNFKHTFSMSNKGLGDAYFTLKKLDKALEFFKISEKIAQELYNINSQNVGIKANLAGIYESLGDCYSELDSLKQGIVYYEKAVIFYEEFCMVYSKQVEFKDKLSYCYNRLSAIYTEANNLNKGLEFCKKCNSLAKEIYSHDTSKIELKEDLATSYTNLVIIYAKLNDLNKALEACQIFHQLSKELYIIQPTNTNFENKLAFSYIGLGELQEKLKNVNQAKIYYLEGYKLYNKLVLYHKNTNNYDYKIQILTTEMRLTEIYKKEKNWKALFQLYETKLKINLQVINPDKKDLATIYNNLAWRSLFTKEFSLSEKYALLGLETYKNHELIYTNLALAYLFQGKLEQAKAIYLHLKDKVYDKKTYKEVFLQDLVDLEKENITHPDVAKIRELLK